LLFGSLWPALIRELRALGHKIVLFERESAGSAAAENRDVIQYRSWASARAEAAKQLAGADAAIVTSASADVPDATRAVLGSNVRVRCFFDLDPAAGARSVPPGGLGGFDVVLTSVGGRALAELKSRLGARHVVPLYGCADPNLCRPTDPDERYRADLSYLGTWTPSLESLFLEPARRRPELRFLAAGCERPSESTAPENVQFLPRVDPEDHARLYCSARMMLSVAPAKAAEMGYCPSNQMFEAAACGIPVLSDDWEGLDYFFEPGREILVARTTGHVMDALALPAERLGQIGRAGMERVLVAHTASRRALELENILEAAISLPVEQTGTVRP